MLVSGVVLRNTTYQGVAYDGKVLNMVYISPFYDWELPVRTLEVSFEGGQNNLKMYELWDQIFILKSSFIFSSCYNHGLIILRKSGKDRTCLVEWSEGEKGETNRGGYFYLIHGQLREERTEFPWLPWVQTIPLHFWFRILSRCINLVYLENPEWSIIKGLEKKHRIRAVNKFEVSYVNASGYWISFPESTIGLR